MIKRIRFATRNKDIPADVFAHAWPGQAALGAPEEVRPVRTAVCTTLPGLTGPAPRHDGLVIDWFTGEAQLRAFEEWLGTQEGDRVLDPGASPVVVAAESVLRGADWLERRWSCGGGKFKHMAVAVRAGGLSPAAFSDRWRNHAGRAGSGVVIPDQARGLAYVQNHPVTGERAYDAVNEVYFDDVAGLRTRIDWFRDNLGEPEDFIGESWFLAVREEMVTY
ncbi:hypothetical protein HFP15_16390 [Amycolatopsis sp. K13G38]|uniref:EthD domain-containing protein n=1 Tax=Amycolatopsis acididurans TaxID=2724524 RepID=A0ABX1J516_9PSEU|nr:hypothetical protein [Amycolatopsis acididurans]NKQ54461.1 hypothetical protein [Amycolatopsis acididurans]